MNVQFGDQQYDAQAYAALVLGTNGEASVLIENMTALQLLATGADMINAVADDIVAKKGLAKSDAITHCVNMVGEMLMSAISATDLVDGDANTQA